MSDSAPRLHVVEYLKTHTLDQLHNDFAIQVRSHPSYPSIFQLRYNQIFSPFHEPIVQECRNLVLDIPDTANYHARAGRGRRSKRHVTGFASAPTINRSAYPTVIAWGFKKFFNRGEQNAIPESSLVPPLRVYEKIDGSIMMLYRYDNKWHLSSSSIPDGKGPLTGVKKGGSLGTTASNHMNATTFAGAFWEVFRKLSYTEPSIPETESDSLCYIFELYTPGNIVLVRYDEPFRLVLLGVRNCSDPTLPELRPEPFAERYGWECISPLDSLTNLEEVLTECKKVDPLKCEGFVVVDSNYDRLKIKSPQYVALHSMRGTKIRTDEGSIRKNRKKLLRVITLNDADEFLAYFESLRPMYTELKHQFDIVVSFLEEIREEVGEEDETSFILNSNNRFREPWNKTFASMFQFDGSIQEFFGAEDDLARTSSILNSFIYDDDDVLPVDNTSNLPFLLSSIEEDAKRDWFPHIGLSKRQRVVLEEIEREIRLRLECDGTVVGAHAVDMVLRSLPVLSIVTGREDSDSSEIEAALESISHFESFELKSPGHLLCSHPRRTVAVQLFFGVPISENMEYLRSEFIRKYLGLHPKISDLMFLIEYITTERVLMNSSLKGGLGAYSLSLMFIFYLQQVGIVPVLPVETEEEGEGEGEVDDFRFEEHLHGFFRFYASRISLASSVVSVRTGTVLPRESGGDSALVVVEEPFMPDLNVASKLSWTARGKLQDEFDRAATLLAAGGSLEDVVGHRKPGASKRKRGQ